MGSTERTAGARERLQAIADRYRQGHDRPLGGYLALIGAYTGVTSALTATAAATDRLPKDLGAGDLVLFGVATHKLARIIAKESIASPIRAPFTTYEGVSGPAELSEDVRAEGWRKALGELVTCPFCMGQWIATGFVFGSGFAPRVTRAVAATFAVHALSDALQFGYAGLEGVTDRLGRPAEADGEPGPPQETVIRLEEERPAQPSVAGG